MFQEICPFSYLCKLSVKIPSALRVKKDSFLANLLHGFYIKGVADFT